MRAEYTEGICGDGAAILKDGVIVPISQVLEELNRAEGLRAFLEDIVLKRKPPIKDAVWLRGFLEPLTPPRASDAAGVGGV